MFGSHVFFGKFLEVLKTSEDSKGDLNILKDTCSDH